jgi:O-antigen chain-terminating methyltransferase
VHGEVRRYVDLLVGKQIDFNVHLVHFVNRLIPGIEDRLKQTRSEISEEISDRVGHVRADIGTERDDKLGLLKSDIGTERDDKLGLLKSDIGTEMDNKLGLLKSDIKTERDDKLGLLKSDIGTEMDDKLGLLKSDIGTDIDDKVSHVRAEICTEIEGKVNDVVATVNDDIKNKAWLANLLEQRIGKKKDDELPFTGAEEDMNFFVFEEKFRGTREDIKGRQLKFLEYSQGCKNVLDIGCGRGEFLEILKENGITAKGIDINEDMVIYCQSKGLNVERTDAVDYLEGLEDKSLDSIFLDQVVEHLAPEYLMKMLDLCYSKLKFGFYMVIETVDEYKLKKVEIGEDIEEKERRIIEVYNYNTNKLNETLFGYQDYAVIGKK